MPTSSPSIAAVRELAGAWLVLASARAAAGYPELLHLTLRIPPWAGAALGLLLLARRVQRLPPGWARRLALTAASLATALALRDAVDYWRAGPPGLPIPASLGVAALALLLGVDAARGTGGLAAPTRWALGLTAAVAIPLVPLVEMTTFGLSDYRRPADVGVVFGARVYRDGRLSDAARDRVTEAVRCYAEGLVGTLVMSGGPGDGPLSEPEAMAREAERLGVPNRDIWLDLEGLNTRRTLDNLAVMAAESGWHRVLAVSHFYHLSRIKLECGRVGLDCFTVPATEPRPLPRLPWFMAREVLGWWRAALLPF